MRSYAFIKKIFLIIDMITAVILIITGRVPELPSSKPESVYNVSSNISEYFTENIFAIGAFIAHLLISIVILLYGISMLRHIKASKDIGKVTLSLGIFTLLSGIWILTDSRALEVFAYDSSRLFSRSTVIFISYISIMLMPIFFLACLRHMKINSKVMLAVDGLLQLNFTFFTLFCALQLPKIIYFCLLFILHSLLCILTIAGIVFYFQHVKGSSDKDLKSIFHSIIQFMIFVLLAVIVFLMGSKKIYSIIYTTGFCVLNIKLLKIFLGKTLSMYKDISKVELYKSLAYSDSLTSIENRNAFIKDQNEIKIDGNTCLIIMDINGLKKVNDTLGHHYGDQLIRRAAAAVKEAFSAIGVCYRIGGDEFAVICKNTSEDELEKAVNNMLKKIESENEILTPPLSLAYGYAFGSSSTEDAASLFTAADSAMYRNKNEQPVRTPKL